MDTYRPFADAAAREHRDTESMLTRRELVISWTCRMIAAGIMTETLFFKFTGSLESVWIFSKMNMEAWGRYGQGVWELLASVLLLASPRTVWLGCFLTLGAARRQQFTQLLQCALLFAPGRLDQTARRVDPALVREPFDE